MQLTRDEESQLKLVHKSLRTHQKLVFNDGLLKVLEKRRLVRLTGSGPRLTPDGERALRDLDDE